MDELTGKTLIFTDLHCGLSGNKLSKLKICEAAVADIEKTARERGVRNIIFAGDWFHSRSVLDTNTVNVSLGLVRSLAEGRKLYLICGNHDSYFKNTTDVNSINIFRDSPNVKVVYRTDEILLNGDRALLVPWLGDVSPFKAGGYGLVIGHFDVSARYIMNSYVEEHSKAEKAGAGQIAALEADGLAPSAADDESVAGFAELARPGGVVYAGHIHQHREFSTKGREFVFVGSPYQQNFGEIECDSGYYVLDERNRREFVRTSGVPKHVRLLMSKAAEFDFSEATGSIVQKVYDVDVDRDADAEIQAKLTAAAPYEEALPEYRVSVSRDGAPTCQEAELIRRDKLDYIRKYVENESDGLKARDIDPDRLFSVLKKYYVKACGE